jgi:hypothetical protein
MNARVMSSYELPECAPVSLARAVRKLAIGQLAHGAFTACLPIAAKFTLHRAHAGHRGAC